MPNTGNNGTVKVVEIKPEFYADIHGRQLPQIIDSCSNGKDVLTGVVAWGADMKNVYSLAAKFNISGCNKLDVKILNVKITQFHL